MNYDPMKPIWLQVATRLKRQIATGTLAPGAKLPGGRELATQYGINPNTAARIYQELEREGVCATSRGLGTFVTEDERAVQSLRREMAHDALEQFLEELSGLGMTVGDAIDLIKREESNNDHMQTTDEEVRQ